MGPVLQCENLHRHFTDSAGTLKVLNGVDLSIQKGEVVAILGPSGSGKSTLLHLLGGLDRPTSGNIILQGRSSKIRQTTRITEEMSQNVGFIFQHHYLLEDLSVVENVALPGLIRGKADWKYAADLLKQVGLESKAAESPKKLAGGERQRVAVARALYPEPNIILADEPTGSLDTVNAHLVFTSLVSIARRNGTSVLLATHDESLVKNVDFALRLKKGKIAKG
jgi:lipoprotein-releasing system ATP-binding protein